MTVSGPFSGLNDTDSSITLTDGESQDTLNVEISKNALALKKRKGYSLLYTLTTATEPIHGAIYFKSQAGDNIKIYAHDSYISVSKNGGAFTNLMSTGAPLAKWSFCVSDGQAYGFNDGHQTPWSYNGTTMTYYSTMPKASLCSMTVDRMLLAGTTDYPNRLYFSRSGTITDFTVGTTPEAPGFEDIGLAGEKITNIFATQAEWLIFKTNSFTSYQGSNQFDLVPSVISEKVGMNEPHAIVQHEGIIYFKAIDGKLWGYTSGTLSELSKKISNFVEGITKDNVNSKEYTSKTDFDSGIYYKSTGSITSGSVEPYQFISTDTLSADFNAGVLTGSATVSGDSVLLYPINDVSISSLTQRNVPLIKSWYDIAYGTGIFVAISYGSNTAITSSDGIAWSSYTTTTEAAWEGITFGNNLFVAVAENKVMTSPDGQTWTARTPATNSFWRDVVYGNGIYVATAYAKQYPNTALVMTSPDGIVWSTRTIPEANRWEGIAYGNGLFVAVSDDGTNQVMTSPDGITWTARNSPNSYWLNVTYGNGLFVAVAELTSPRIMTSPDGITWTERTVPVDRSFYGLAYGDGLFVGTNSNSVAEIIISTNGVNWSTATGVAQGLALMTYGNGKFVFGGGSSVAKIHTADLLTYTTTGTFVSRPHAIETAVSSQTYYGYITYTSSVPTGSQIDWFVRNASATTGTYSLWAATTQQLLLSSTNTAWEYKAALYKTTSLTTPVIYDAALVFKTTGYWESPEVPLLGVGSWGIFSANSSLDNAASLTYTMAVTTFAGGTASATRESVTSGSVIAVSTGAYTRIRATDNFTTATETVKLNSAYISWTTTPDKMANAFEYLGDIYFSVPYLALSNTRLLKFDTAAAGWNIFDIGVNSPLNIDGSIWFGSPTGAYIYQYPSGDNDNGNAINSHWKSKNYIGSNPYVEKQFQRLSLIAGSDYGSSLDITYTMDTSTSTSYSLSLTSTTSDFVRNNRALPVGEIGTFFNLKIGNNAINQPWSFYGASVDYSDEVWRVMPEN